MAAQEILSLSIALPYVQAGIAFRLHGVCGGGTAPMLEITVVAGDRDEPLSLRQDGVPVLADFAPGFGRWLRTCNVDAEVTTHAIRGRMPPETTAGQLLLAVSRACDMIDQRFCRYAESVLG